MRNRHGFTLIELTISMVLLLFIVGTSVQFLRRQTNLVAREATRMDALQNAQFAATQIERELREAGAGVVDAQPMIAQLDSSALTFNANIVSSEAGDVLAVYQMPDADPSAVRGMLQTEALALPNSSPAKLYPDTTYLAASKVPTAAETISYWLRKDSSTTLPNRFVLFRRVNALPPTLIARGLLKDANDPTPFFTYYTADEFGALAAVPKEKFPIYHVKLHGASNDTGRNAISDSIRAVRLHFRAAARDARTGKDGVRTVDVLVRLMNAGLLQRTTCGEKPLVPGAPTVVSSLANAPVKSVKLTWGKSGDDGGGEKDIERYAVYRRLVTDPNYGDPITSLSASTLVSYSFVDTQVQAGITYVYGIVAQDCTPDMSGLAVSAPVFVQP